MKRLFYKTLGFFNLLDDSDNLSLTTLTVYISFVALFVGHGSLEAVTACVLAFGNYVHKRHQTCKYKQKQSQEITDSLTRNHQETVLDTFKQHLDDVTTQLNENNEKVQQVRTKVDLLGGSITGHRRT